MWPLSKDGSHGSRIIGFALKRRLVLRVKLKDFICTLLHNAEILHHIGLGDAFGFIQPLSLWHLVATNLVENGLNAHLQCTDGFLRCLVFLVILFGLGLCLVQFGFEIFENFFPLILSAGALSLILFNFVFDIGNLPGQIGVIKR